MNKTLYRKLAINNIKKNKSTFFPFGLACGTMVALFYMLLSINNQVSQSIFFGATTMKEILSLGIWVCGIFSVMVVLYTNGFLMKRRNKELGLYSILGLEKNHIGKILFWEIILVGFTSMILGLFGGLLFSKLMFLVLLNMLKLNTGIQFGISINAVIVTLMIFTSIFLVIIIYNNLKLRYFKPIELLQGSNVGEREPKAKWILALLGVICLLVGYYLAITTQNPIQALTTFFVAVLFVIAGTYLLFMSGSIALLKILKRNKKFYYHKTHFITISGMMYRMKQNAVGLANICILSTAVLVVLSTTISLFIGIDDVMRTRYPSDVITNYLYSPEEDAAENLHYNYDNKLIEETMEGHADKYGVELKNIKSYYTMSTLGNIVDEQFTPNIYGIEVLEDYNSMVYLNAMILEDYNSIVGENDRIAELGFNEVYLFSSDSSNDLIKNITFANEVFQVSPDSQSKNLNNELEKRLGEMTKYIFLVVPDFNKLVLIRDAVNGMNQDSGISGINNIIYNYEFNLEGDLTAKEYFSKTLRDALNGADIPHVATVENIFTTRQEFIGIYGSLFFVGIFVGTLFLLTTVMIIYYKQISEGYDDRNRFVIMQKVGMSKEDVKNVIKNQVRMVFYLPIILAIVHIAFAFDIIRKLLVILNLTNVKLFIGCTVGTIFVFVIIYWIVYKLTARSYYKLVNSQD